jgi:hypothetical protein
VTQEGKLFLHVYIGNKSFKTKHLANFNQTRYKHFLHDGNSKVQILFKGGIITKVQKWGRVEIDVIMFGVWDQSLDCS